MERLKLYLFFFGLLIAVKWTFLGEWLQSPSALNIVLVVIGVLLGIIIIIAPKGAKKRKDNSFDNEGA
ncbi:MAG: hypothetical protein J5716_05300 [Alphaproteobacteria bacterium]|nr:hypothetical protein [Alphaproteobacteria bacterium]